MAGSGEKPRFSLTARRKDAPKGSKERVKLGAGFAGKFPGSFNFNMRDVEAIKLKTGEVITLADYWLDLKDWEAGRRRTGHVERWRVQRRLQFVRGFGDSVPRRTAHGQGHRLAATRHRRKLTHETTRRRETWECQPMRFCSGGTPSTPKT